MQSDTKCTGTKNKKCAQPWDWGAFYGMVQKGLSNENIETAHKNAVNTQRNFANFVNSCCLNNNFGETFENVARAQREFAQQMTNQLDAKAARNLWEHFANGPAASMYNFYYRMMMDESWMHLKQQLMNSMRANFNEAQANNLAKSGIDAAGSIMDHAQNLLKEAAGRKNAKGNGHAYKTQKKQATQNYKAAATKKKASSASAKLEIKKGHAKSSIAKKDAPSDAKRSKTKASAGNSEAKSVHSANSNANNNS